jgi:hypothetical protein
MRAALCGACLLAALAPVARAAPRPWLGPALTLDPAFAAGAAGLDWFFSPAAAVGVAVATTFPGAGDRTAAESGYTFLSALARWRLPAGNLRAELVAGAGLARVGFGAPGAHTELAPDLLLGAALALPLSLPRHLELAVELATHVTLGAETVTRNPAHSSEVLALAVRWGP